MRTGRKRRPPPYVIDALARLAEAGERRLPLARFEMMMGGGWTREITLRAVHSMERRGWIVLKTGTIHITDDGHAATTKGVGVVPPKKRALTWGTRHRVASTRMPRGLF